MTFLQYIVFKSFNIRFYFFIYHSYRSSITVTNTAQIQNSVSSNLRTTMFSDPVRSSLGSTMSMSHQRMSTSSTTFCHSLSHNLPQYHPVRQLLLQQVLFRI